MAHPNQHQYYAQGYDGNYHPQQYASLQNLSAQTIGNLHRQASSATSYNHHENPLNSSYPMSYHQIPHPPSNPYKSNSPRTSLLSNSRPMSSSSKTSFSTFTSYAATPKSATTPETSNIRVVVRIRPKTDYEISRENSPSTPNSRVSQLHAPHEDEPVAISPLGDGKSLQLLDISRKGSDEGTKRVLTFHRVYEETTDQERVFEECGVKDLVSQAINGYAATIFAFGQTGSGKTFTITGPEHHWSLHPERLGIIPRALEHLFSETTANHPADTFIIRATYLEIYNELVQDLLSPLASPTSSLPVRWTAERGFYVENAITVECRDLDDCIAVLEEGLKNRSTGAHRLNEYSSRSHSIMTVYIESGEGESMKRGKISFVDLAGSERVRESRAKGDTLTETMSINKSLLTLGNCISALADPKKRNGHIPYRDSNLTKLLSDSLGGSGLALMIACISPSSVNLQESLKTLRYAARARKIRNRPAVQIGPVGDKVLALRREVNGLRRENAALRAAVEFRGAFNPMMDIRSGYTTHSPFQNPQSQPLKLPDISLSSAGSVCSSRASMRGALPPSQQSQNAPSPSPYLTRYLRSTSRTSLDDPSIRLPPLAPGPTQNSLTSIKTKPATSTTTQLPQHPKSKIPTPPKREDAITRHASLDSIKDAIPSKKTARLSRGSVKMDRPEIQSASSAASSSHRRLKAAVQSSLPPQKPSTPSTRESVETLTSHDPSQELDRFRDSVFPLSSLKEVLGLKQMIAQDVDALDREIDMLSSGAI